MNSVSFNSMGSLIFAVIAMTMWQQSIKFAQSRSANDYSIATINYWVAAIFLGSWSVWKHVCIRPDVLLIASLSGVLFGVGFFLFMHCIRESGIGRASVIINLSQSLPVLAAIIFWKERLNGFIIIGLFLIVLAIPMIVVPKLQSQKGICAKAVLSLFLLFICEGIAYSSLKWCEQMKFPDQTPVILTTLSAVAGSVTSLGVIFKRIVPGTIDLLYGSISGVMNVLSTVGLFVSLILLPASIALPLFTIGTIVLTTLISVLLWGERYTYKTYIGLAMGIFAVLLIRYSC